jgi:hypothetical protein
LFPTGANPKVFGKKKSEHMSPDLFRFWLLVVGKLGFKFFLTQKLVFNLFFWLKTFIKQCRNCDKFIYCLKKPKKPSKNWSQPEFQNHRAQICFFTNFKGTKTSNMNFSNQMESFDTNIVYFGGINRCQWYFFSLLSESSDLSLLF